MLGKRKKSEQVIYYLNEWSAIGKVKQTKLLLWLGLSIDDDFFSKKHINLITTKIWKISGILGKTGNTLIYTNIKDNLFY